MLLMYRTEEHSLQRRGRWSTAGFERSVDLDALVDAPSPSNSPVRLSRLRRRRTRNKSKSEASHRPTLLTCAENSRYIHCVMLPHTNTHTFSIAIRQAQRIRLLSERMMKSHYKQQPF